jgi:adenylate kinase
MRRYLVLLGAPGAGKGTQAKRLSAGLNLAHISSGDIFREHLDRRTDLGELARGFMDRGELVPDDVTIGMIADRLRRPDCKSGALLDGFPRTPAQAEALDRLAGELGGRVERVLFIQVPRLELVRRLSGRLMCREHGHIYHQDFNPPKQAGVCDIDGSELYQRVDDQAETVTHRIEVYLEQTQPLIEHYRRQGLLSEVDGQQPMDVVSDQLIQALEFGAGG